MSRRQKGEKEATRKRKIGVKFARLLGYIPTIQFIGLSGKVASGSASASDDIDFFIITKKKTLFATRILVLLVLEVLGKRRRRNESQEKDKICVNFFVEETALSFPQERHDLYTAREIAQLIPLFERNRMYGTFLTRNNWMRSFLPHTIRRKSYITEHTYSIKGRILLKILTVPGVEMLLQRLQLSLIASHKTTETVTKQFLAFHPRDYRQKTMQKFSRAVTFYEPIFSEKQAETKLDYIDKGKNIFYTA